MKAAFYPQPLLDCQKLYYVGFDVVGIDDSPDVVFNWNWQGTYWINNFDQIQQPVVNQFCVSSRKNYIDTVLKSVYGYSSQHTGAGWCVEKNNLTNGAKDSRMIKHDGDEPDKFYQIPFIDLVDQEYKFKEYRIAIMDYKPVITILKHKVVSMFDIIGKVTEYEFIECPDDRIETYCRFYNLEYGELDACYWKGKFYIYDVNPTPGNAMFVKMPVWQSIRLQTKYKKHLFEWLERKISRQ